MTLTELQQQLAAQKLDACIITRNNQFLGQDILPEENRLQRLTGFSGSAGNLLVFRDRAFLFTDGRYELQAARETDPEQVEVVITNGQSLGSWLQNHTESQKLRIAFNPWCHTVSETDFWKRTLKNIEFVEDAGLLSAALLSAKECNIFEHDIEFAGISMDEKIADLTEFMRQNKLDAFLLTACDSVSWLLNLRSDCLPDTPIVRAFAFINALGEVSLFTTDFTKLESELKNYKNRTVGMDCKRSPRALFSLMKKHKIWIENLPDPVQNRKAVKNPVEISGLRKAHLRDGAAVVRLLIWLEQNYNGQTELDVVKKLHDLRAAETNFFSNSFETIAGFAANGAIVHYQPLETTSLKLASGSLLLLDSGAQYLDGTTDITRTIALGSPEPEMIRDFTVVLKAHIALASACFPDGTPGLALDAIAREPLWKCGKNYTHGTGHGVGFFLNVHEGPVSISSRNALTPLAENMITSIEPGYYKENAYGIRIENLARVTRHNSPDFEIPMLCFETLTFVPLDKKLIDKYLLSEEERTWLNNYHRQVFERIAPLLNEAEKDWLRNACAPLE